MEFLLTSSNSKSVSDQNFEDDSFEPGGLLNSKYQKIVSLSQSTSSANSLYRLKQRIQTKRFQLDISAELLLKLTVFTCIILAIFN